VPGAPGLPGANQAGAANPPDFAAEFRRQLESVQFSQHARQRLALRRVVWGAEEGSRLAGAVQALASKGGRTSLVLLDDLALVVSVPNRTVITAVRSREQNVFTNIDSAITA
jgi:flagellar operon protein